MTNAAGMFNQNDIGRPIEDGNGQLWFIHQNISLVFEDKGLLKLWFWEHLSQASQNYNIDIVG